MSDPFVDSWLHLPKGDYNARELKSKLTLTGHVSDLAPTDADVLVELYHETADHILVPRQAGFLRPEIIRSAIDCTVLGDARDFGEPIKLRPGQIPVVNNFMDALETTNPYGGQLIAAAGGGKTVMGLEIIRRIGRTTVVLVHKEFLVRQWITRILHGEPEKGIPAFLPNARVGIVQQDRCEYGDDYDIVICMIQSLAQREYPEDFYRWAGVVVSDETHRLGADTWHPVIGKFPAKVRVGLTATPRRKDRMEPVFYWHIGPILSRASREATGTLKPVVRVVRWDKRYNMGRYQMRNGKFNIAKWITDVSENEERNELILTWMKKALENNRKIIALSHRRDQLDYLASKIEEWNPDIVQDFYVGSRKQDDLDEAAKAQLVWATYQMAAEGLDIPELDCEFLLTPASDVEQAVGRIQRIVDGKLRPLVFDFVDTAVGVGEGLAGARRRIYAKIGATVK